MSILTTTESTTPVQPKDGFLHRFSCFLETQGGLLLMNAFLMIVFTVGVVWVATKLPANERLMGFLQSSASVFTGALTMAAQPRFGAKKTEDSPDKKA